MFDIVYFNFFEWVFIAVMCFIILSQVKKQHSATNSRLDELLETTKQLARMEGFKAGQLDQYNKDRLTEISKKDFRENSNN